MLLKSEPRLSSGGSKAGRIERRDPFATNSQPADREFRERASVGAGHRPWAASQLSPSPQPHSILLDRKVAEADSFPPDDRRRIELRRQARVPPPWGCPTSSPVRPRRLLPPRPLVQSSSCLALQPTPTVSDPFPPRRDERALAPLVAPPALDRVVAQLAPLARVRLLAPEATAPGEPGQGRELALPVVRPRRQDAVNRARGGSRRRRGKLIDDDDDDDDRRAGRGRAGRVGAKAEGSRS